MEQRLGIACSLIHNPNFVILDEPTNSLDVKGIKDIREFIKFIKEQGKSVIVSSHMLSEIEEICDSSIIISNGSIIDVISNNMELHNSNKKYIITIPYIENTLKIIKNEKYIVINNTIIEVKTFLIIETGIGSSFYDWYSIVEEIKKYFTVVLYHGAGYGKSQVSDEVRTTRNIAKELNELIEKIGIEDKFILMGHSFGELCV